MYLWLWERLLCGRCTKQGFCAIHSKFDTSSLKENCKKNICEQNTRLFLSQTFEPPLASAKCQRRCLRLPLSTTWVAASHPRTGFGVITRPSHGLRWLTSHPNQTWGGSPATLIGPGVSRWPPQSWVLSCPTLKSVWNHRDPP